MKTKMKNERRTMDRNRKKGEQEKIGKDVVSKKLLSAYQNQMKCLL